MVRGNSVYTAVQSHTRKCIVCGKKRDRENKGGHARLIRQMEKYLKGRRTVPVGRRGEL